MEVSGKLQLRFQLGANYRVDVEPHRPTRSRTLSQKKKGAVENRGV